MKRVWVYLLPIVLLCSCAELQGAKHAQTKMQGMNMAQMGTTLSKGQVSLYDINEALPADAQINVADSLDKFPKSVEIPVVDTRVNIYAISPHQ